MAETQNSHPDNIEINYARGKRRILIIDDNHAIHDDFRKILNHDSADEEVLAAEQALFGESTSREQTVVEYDLDSAYQGEEGLGKVTKALEDGASYALAFVDMRMPPGWDGLETIARIFEADQDIQVVICTAYSDYSWNQIVDRLGTSDRLLILKKPFDCAEVRQLAAALTEKWRLGRKAAVKMHQLESAIQERMEELSNSNEKLRLEIAQREEAEDKLRHHALHDALTELPNRVLLMDRLGRCCERSRREPDYHYAVLYMDIDNFKLVNDSLGHPYGDKLLVEVAKRLNACIRAMDTNSRPTANTTARLGGDEFVILLDTIREVKDAVRVAQRIHLTLKEPFFIDGHEVVSSGSIGIAVGHESNYTCSDDILRDADTALYEAKRDSKGNFKVFDSHMRSRLIKRHEIERDLHKALERNELDVAYQPIVSLINGRLKGFEALLRWHHPDSRNVPPDLFVPIAEETGQILQIGEWVLRQACGQMSQWHKQYEQHRNLSISVNISPRQIQHPDFIAMLDEVLAETELDSGKLNLELTEGVLMNQDKSTMALFGHCEARKINLHMDDFGTGYSSLSYLHNLPVGTIKLDRSFVQNLDLSGEYTATVQAMVVLANNRGISIIAEGIETSNQLVQLQALDCEYGQGFYFAKPMSPELAGDLLAQDFVGYKCAS